MEGNIEAVTELREDAHAKDDDDDDDDVLKPLHSTDISSRGADGQLHWPRTTELLDVAKLLETDYGRATTQGE